MKYGIIGTGAIGGYYGGKLANDGQEVHFLMHRDYEYVKQHGLQVDSCDGSFHLDHVHAYAKTSEMPPCDVVLVCLKSTNNHLLQTFLPPLLHKDTLVVLIQNGIGLEDDVQALFPNVALAAGLAFICSAKTEPVVDEFNHAGIKAGLVVYQEARWKKAVWNMPFNGMTVALHTQTDLLLKNPSTRQLIRDQMMEVVGAAQHLGVKNIDEAFVDLMIQMTDEMTPYSPSMRLDYDFHRPLEIHYIYSRPIEIARQAGFHMPKLEMLESELRFLSQDF